MPDVIQEVVAVVHPSDIAATRRAGVQLAKSLGFDERAEGKLAIIITEAATNILKHAASGRIVIGSVHHAGMSGVEVLALDKGPGIANFAQSLRDGVSSAGTAGNGLGAMRRQSDEFDVYTFPGKGSAFRMCIWAGQREPGFEPVQMGAVSLPMPGEEECGDAWVSTTNEDAIMLLVVDGLGHGPEAARAAQAAVRTATERPGLPPGLLIDAAHVALRPTRGAALAAARLSQGNDELNFAGIGNISACLITGSASVSASSSASGSASKQLMSHNGIVGHNLRKVQEFKLDWPSDTLFVMHSDGISKHWDLDSYPGLSLCHPSLIAGILYRDFARERDDVTVVVAKRRRLE